jgi:hypothetical protein
MTKQEADAIIAEMQRLTQEHRCEHTVNVLRKFECYISEQAQPAEGFADPEQDLNAALKRIHATYGNDLDAFFRELRSVQMQKAPKESESCSVCGYPLDDGEMHSIPGNRTELCSHIPFMNELARKRKHKEPKA